MTSHGTQLLSGLPWHDPRIHPLDDTWLLTIFTIVRRSRCRGSSSGLEIDFAATGVGLLILGAIHLGFTALSSRATRNPIRLTRTLSALHALGVIAVAFIWQHAGGVQNPLFLMVFALPVIGAIFLSRWQPYFVPRGCSHGGTGAASQAPELRWYVPLGLSATVDWLGGVLVRTTGAGSLRSRASTRPPYFRGMLEAFVIMLFACAVASEYSVASSSDCVDRLRPPAPRRAQPGAVVPLVDQLPLPRSCWMPRRMKSFAQARRSGEVFRAVMSRSLAAYFFQRSTLLPGGANPGYASPSHLCPLWDTRHQSAVDPHGGIGRWA